MEELERKYSDVNFVKVNESVCPGVVQAQGIKGFPTFRFFIAGRQVDELVGANPHDLEGKVTQHRVPGGGDKFSGSGNSLGGTAWDGVGLPPPSNTRDARLRAFGNLEQKKPPAATAASTSTSSSSATPAADTSVPMEESDETKAMAEALVFTAAAAVAAGTGVGAKPSATSAAVDATQSDQQQAENEVAAEIQAEFMSKIQKGPAATDSDSGSAAAVPAAGAAAAAGEDWDGEAMVPVPVDEGQLQQLVEMGFSDVRGRKGLVHGKTVDGAVAWLESHQDDADIDQPYMVRTTKYAL